MLVAKQLQRMLVGAFINFGSSYLMGQAKEPAAVFRPALDQIRDHTRIPILLPSKLPFPIRERDIKNASGKVTEDGYFIELYYTEMGMGASFAAGFGGSTRVFRVPTDTRVALTGGRVGMFSPVSCGGSCAPANLYWEEDGVIYQIQLKLRSTMSKKEQKRILVATANSTVPVQRH